MALPRSRFSDIVNPELVKKHSPITVIGAGGIGSRVFETLGQIGFNLDGWEPDIVAPENIGPQKFGFPDIGKLKIDVLKERLETNYRVSVATHKEKFSGQQELTGIVILGVDTKEERAKIWESSIKYNPNIPLLLDGRVGADRYKLFCVNPCDPVHIDKYNSQLDLTKPQMETRCTAKFAPEAGMALDFYMWVAIKQFMLGEKVPFMVAGKNFDARFVY